METSFQVLILILIFFPLGGLIQRNMEMKGHVSVQDLHVVDTVVPLLTWFMDEKVSLLSQILHGT